ncbi:MAG: hypothetical protein QME66_04730 [Candidatus Eisenbacteria bacterium]|nr:hypothetical protein [Candidatus Eisenbacteria bacterium]
MSFRTLTDAELAQGIPVAGLRFKERDEYLLELISKGQTIAQGVPNGGFDYDGDEDGQPDWWAFVPYPGGSGTLVDTVAGYTWLQEGSKSYQMTSPGDNATNGGGVLTSSYIELSPLVDYLLSGIVHSSKSGAARVKVTLDYYASGKTYVSTATLLNYVPNVQTALWFARSFRPPATARYIRINLCGGVPHTVSVGAGATQITWDVIQLNESLRWQAPMGLDQRATVSGTWYERYRYPLAFPYMDGELVMVAMPIELASNGSATAYARMRLSCGIPGQQGVSNVFATTSATYKRGILTVIGRARTLYGIAHLYVDLMNSSGSIVTMTRLPYPTNASIRILRG